MSPREPTLGSAFPDRLQTFPLQRGILGTSGVNKDTCCSLSLISPYFCVLTCSGLLIPSLSQGCFEPLDTLCISGFFDPLATPHLCGKPDPCLPWVWPCSPGRASLWVLSSGRMLSPGAPPCSEPRRHPQAASALLCISLLTGVRCPGSPGDGAAVYPLGKLCFSLLVPWQPVLSSHRWGILFSR